MVANCVTARCVARYVTRERDLTGAGEYYTPPTRSCPVQSRPFFPHIFLRGRVRTEMRGLVAFFFAGLRRHVRRRSSVCQRRSACNLPRGPRPEDPPVVVWWNCDGGVNRSSPDVGHINIFGCERVVFECAIVPLYSLLSTARDLG